MKRRSFVKGLAAATALPVVGGIAIGAQSSDAATPDSLVFDKSTYSVLTTTVTTADGTKQVTYHFYKAITYVANPVDAKYQSLNISVPITIDGTAVDTTDAPILLSNSIGGYLSSSVADATGIGSGMGGPPPGGGAPGPSGAPTGSASAAATSTAAATATATTSTAQTNWNNATLALAAGFVVVEPGARGRDLVSSSGDYYGVAPAAIVDLKAAVRYLRFNKSRMPGNTDRIVSTGVSAGGALSTLLGASGDSPEYDTYLKALGAADASDAIFAVGAYCPITDLDHADMAYEWCWGGNALSSGALVDQTVSKELSSAFTEYQNSLKLHKNGFGAIRARNYDEYLVDFFLEPSATAYLKALSDADRSAYLSSNSWITWSGGEAKFAWAGFLKHVGARKKDTPAFDAFDLSAGENNEFGLGTTKARHFTLYSLRHATGNASARLDGDLPEKINLMNPMHFIEQRNPNRSKHWFLRVGTDDTDSSPVIVGNLTAGLEDLGDEVDPAMYWDAPHGANYDGPLFIEWIGKVTGHAK